MPNSTGIKTSVQVEPLDYGQAQERCQKLAAELDDHRGVLLSSSYEYPGRYTTWDIGFVNPPVVITASRDRFSIQALNARGEILLPFIAQALQPIQVLMQEWTVFPTEISGRLQAAEVCFNEAERTRQTSIFTVLRTLLAAFKNEKEPHLGFYGAFGYDLVFQLQPVALKIPRDPGQRDLVLYLPDELHLVDHRQRQMMRRTYDFSWQGKTTHDLPRTGENKPYNPGTGKSRRDYEAGEYAEMVEIAKAEFKCGNLFEVVPGQSFFEPCQARPSRIFEILKERNPSPYGFIMNLGESEYLVGASPEMYVRVNGQRVETCPISGTIARGNDALSDATQILKLLNSEKEASELTMCTDVDRNDKSRVCEPGSVRVIGRRQIEMYSRLIHTVDHVEGQLKPGYDALDAFLTHAWAVTVTGAPKVWAIEFLEAHERSPRHWYAGAVGVLNFNGDMNTGLTLRTMRIHQGVAEIRAGATLLFDSLPEEEEKETELKASALIDAVHSAHQPLQEKRKTSQAVAHFDQHILLIDHEDSFVLTLANYLSQLSSRVTTLRYDFPKNRLDELKPDLVVLSPGPGKPSDFNVHDTIKACLSRNIPLFGVCLGLQGLVEYFGGELGVLDYPMHGKSSVISVSGQGLFKGFPPKITVGRYHSLYAIEKTLPPDLAVTAKSEDGIIMAIEHQTLPVRAVQFHPESILSLQDGLGFEILRNVLLSLKGH